MAFTFGLDAYLERIDYRGPRAATLDTLEAVHALHPAAIPFENLNPLLGWPVALDAGSLEKKMIADRRGGWCFEHNTLFRHALEALGFRVTALAARVLWNAPPEPVGPRNHMLLLVDLRGLTYIADVGFGGNVLTAPLRVERDTLQPTPHETHRLTAIEGGFVLEACIRDEWQRLYRFTLEPQFPSDYEVSSWHLCHHPSSFFRRMLVCARSVPECRYALRDTTLHVHRKQASERKTLANAEALRACLENEIGIRLPESPELDRALERLTQAADGPNATGSELSH
jgi:N-hydroxyarylamine O-acetyltransferase